MNNKLIFMLYTLYVLMLPHDVIVNNSMTHCSEFQKISRIQNTSHTHNTVPHPSSVKADNKNVSDTMLFFFIKHMVPIHSQAGKFTQRNI